MAHKFTEHFAHLNDKYVHKKRSMTRVVLTNPLAALREEEETDSQISMAEPLDICSVFTPSVKVGNQVLFPAHSAKPMTLTIKRLSQNGHAVAFHPLSGSQLYINLLHVTLLH